MGNEAICDAKLDGKKDHGKALLETTELIFRGAKRLVIPFATIAKATAAGEWLVLDHAGGRAELALGEKSATSWAKKITSPKSVLDKLGVKKEHVVAVVGVGEASFLADLAARTGSPPTTKKKDVDVVFVLVSNRDELANVAKAIPRIKRDGAIWVVRPKGSKEIVEADTRIAAKKAGLVDVKVVAFSPTHTAEKLVIPVAKR